MPNVIDVWNPDSPDIATDTWGCDDQIKLWLVTETWIIMFVKHNQRWTRVLLRERKRHTARRVAYARYAGGGGGDTPSSHGGGGVPHPVQHHTWDGVPPPSRPSWVPPTIQTWLGSPPPPPSRPGWGTSPPPPPQTLDGVPPSRPGWGTPHHLDLDGVTPPPHHPDLDGVPPPPYRPGCSTPLHKC